MLYKNLLTQISLIIPIFFIFFTFQLCIMPCYSVAYGMGISLLNVCVSTVASVLGSRIADKKPAQGVAIVFILAGVRFVMIGVLFAVGMSVLKLNALNMLLAFVIIHLFGQLANLVFSLKSNLKK